MDGKPQSEAPLALLIDDLEEIRRVVRERLLANGINVIEATSGEAGLKALATHRVDVVVLDVGLPGIDGFDVLRSIRQTSQVPVVMLTGADHEADRVLGLEMGADDYVLKPFSSRELVARVRAVLRRVRPAAAASVPVMTFRRLTVDTSARVASVDGSPLALTPREFDLLVFMSSSPGKSFTREELLREVWQSTPEWQNVATVTEHVHRLRRHVEADPPHPTHLITVRGSGYRFEP
ncbi:MAG: response regulator transcription factor [Actinomycetota bacterium]